MRTLLSVLTLGICLFCFCLPLSATGPAEEYVEETLDDLNTQLQTAIPEEAEDLLEQLDLQEMDLQQILSLEPRLFLQVIQNELAEQWQAPCSTLGKVLGILLLAAFLLPLQDTLLKENSKQMFQLVLLLSLGILFAQPVADCIQGSIQALKHCASFLLALIPILCAILVIAGQAATASAYHFLLFGACELISQLAVNSAAPLVGIYFALSMVFCLLPDGNLQSLSNSIKNVLSWSLGIATTIFVGLLSLQTFVSSNVDVVTMKASRFLMGSFIPVVGSILSEAFAAAQGCVCLLKSTVGSFALVVALCSILPTLLQVILWYGVTCAATQVGDLLDVKPLTNLLKTAGNSFALLLAMLSCFLLLSIVAISLVIFIGTGGR